MEEPCEIPGQEPSAPPPPTRRPLDLDEAITPQGKVYIIPERCKGCNYCITYCPKDVLVFSKDINAKGYHFAEVASGKEEACVRCRFCDLVCPEMAIYTEEVEVTEADSGSENE